jgi:hypothetical protein
MLSPYSQFSPQGLTPQFPGLLFGVPGAGVSPLNPLSFAQGGAYGAGSQPGFVQGQGGFPQGAFIPSPFGTPQQNPWSPSPQGQSHGPWAYGYGAQPNSFAGQSTALHVGSLIAQLAQQISIQCAIAQQSGLALLQLAQQLIQQGLQQQGGHQQQGFQPGFQGYSGFGADAGYGGGQPFMGGQHFMTQPFARPQTIQ